MKNKLIIANRNEGKTTYLFEKIKEAFSSGKQTIILDSATEHKEKSLLEKIKSFFPVTTISFENEKFEINEIENKLYENINKDILGVDLAFFLEKGHVLGDSGDAVGYEYNRTLYRKLCQYVVSSLLNLSNKNILKNAIVFMDEVELPYSAIYPEQSDYILFFAGVHPENSFGNFYLTFEQSNFKPYNQSCGSACLDYIYKKEKIDVSVDKDFKWITELFMNLTKNIDYEIKLYCYKSRLYREHKHELSDFNIIEKILTQKILRDEVSKNKYVIVNVESKTFNNDSIMSGGHFVILNGMHQNKVNVINPRKTSFEFLQLTPERIIDCVKNFGNWRLTIDVDNLDKRIK